jgi:phenylpropionate dioxygenase-like ring-hydroxylating dioxygenase large terminal subunit
MLVTRQPVLRRFWYPVMPLSRLAAGPQPFTLLGEKIVLWQRADGTPRRRARPLLPPQRGS